MGISELQTFLYVLASRFAHPPDRSHRCPRLRQGSRGFYVRAEHASLPPHASDMLAVRIQVIDGERTFTPPDSQPYRLLHTLRPSRRLPAPLRSCTVRFASRRSIAPRWSWPTDPRLDYPGCYRSRNPVRVTAQLPA